uniref:Uncharacterized protein n=1 Tax=Romanomermis culicivorax TaxID=13658 RepID=A0A915J4V2_ROMCU
FSFISLELPKQASHKSKKDRLLRRFSSTLTNDLIQRYAFHGKNSLAENEPASSVPGEQASRRSSPSRLFGEARRACSATML